jgi:hypothetical protein
MKKPAMRTNGIGLLSAHGFPMYSTYRVISAWLRIQLETVYDSINIQKLNQLINGDREPRFTEHCVIDLTLQAGLHLPAYGRTKYVINDI